MSHSRMAFDSSCDIQKTLSMTLMNCHKHASSLLRGFQSLQEEGQLCDLELILGTSQQTRDSEKFPVHKVLLAASCESVQLQYQRLQKEGTVMPCGNILPKVLSIFLGYVYSGTISVRAELVAALVSVADQFGCKSLYNLCMQLLKRISSKRQGRALSEEDWTFSVVERQEMYLLQKQDSYKKGSGSEACKTTETVPLDGQLGLAAVPGITDRRIYIRNEYHTKEVVQGLQAIQCDASMCDVVLEADGDSFWAHRAVLATCSDYFRAMFTVGMRECVEDRVVLRDISARGLGVVVSYMYTGTVQLSPDTVDIVLEVSHVLLVSNVIDLCCDYLIQTMSAQNCLTALQLAYRYSLSDVETAADDCILANIPQVSQTPEFKDLTCEELCLYLESDRLEVTREVDAFQAAATWINHDLDSRTTLAD